MSRRMMAAVALIGALTGCAATTTPVPVRGRVEPLVGRWTGDAQIVVQWADQKQLPIDLVIARDGTVSGTQTLPITGTANDSGPITRNYAAGAAIQLSVSTPAGCAAPSAANVVVQYKAQ